ncbi:MAG: MogA/MoaB family molybdenum cofactor biosynthesis protein [Armatimonadetes bacterium]|nr:MogA/MoaB family molybdenum cofactor biosynthesis protein [Armatimonadota bacterium]
MADEIRSGILTISDRCAAGIADDHSGPLIEQALRQEGHAVVFRNIVSDEPDEIEEWLMLHHTLCDVIFTTGGTGFAPRDVTPEATRRVIEREAPGLSELLRWSGYSKNPRAALSRGIAGTRGSCLIINLPGSTRAVSEGLEVILPLLPHIISLMKNEPIDH